MGFYYNTTIGALLAGVFFNTFLYGLVTYQFAAYFRTKFNDHSATKYMVLFLFILDTFHSVAVIYMAWNYTVTNYANPAALAVAQWPHPFTPIATALTALVTQVYLGTKIWRLTSSKLLYGVVVFLAITSSIFGIACGIEAWEIKVLAQMPRLAPIGSAWLSLQAIVDTFITVTLVIIFYRSRTGFSKTDTILNRLIRGAIQTGLFAGVFALCDLTTFILFPDMDFYAMFAIPIGRIYTNTLLDTLLTRELFRAETDGRNNVSIVMDTYLEPTSTIEPTNTQLAVPSTRQFDVSQV